MWMKDKSDMPMKDKDAPMPDKPMEHEGQT